MPAISATDGSDARVDDRMFIGVAVLVVVASTAATIRSGMRMSAMGEMPMPGGWTMSMAWMRMPGETWLGAAASFVAMWIGMTAAMMWPPLLTMLRRYRRAVTAAHAARLDASTALVGAGYLFVWTAFGAAAFPIGVALASAAMSQPALARAAPFAAGAVVLLAGGLQLGAWKARQLECCRAEPSRSFASAHAGTAALAAWRHGVHLGVCCCRCCAGLTAALFAVGVMDLRAMAAIGAAIGVERLARDGERAARAVGVLLIGSGLLLIVRAAASLG